MRDSYVGKVVMAFLPTVGLFLVLVAIFGCFNLIGKVDNTAALQQFRALSKTPNVQIIKTTQELPIFGDPKDVTFLLNVKGNIISGRCTSGIFSPLICREYQGGQ